MVNQIIEACLQADGTPNITWEEFYGFLTKFSSADPNSAARLVSKLMHSYGDNRKWLSQTVEKIQNHEDWKNSLVDQCKKKIEKEKDRLDKFTLVDICLARLNQTYKAGGGLF
jgi:hypothetical protein